MITREKVLALVLVLLMATAGCAGFGTDAPADGPGDQNESGQGDDPDQANGGTAAGETNDGGADSGAAEGDDENGAGSGSDGGDDTDTDAESGSATDDAEDGSGAGDAESGTSGSDGDDGTSTGTDETGDESSGDGEDDSSGEDDADGDDDSDEQGTLTVTVEDESGDPVEEMIVAGIGPNDRRHDGRTDENGQVTFDLPDGDYDWETDTEGTDYEGDTASVTMDGTDESITMTVTPRTSDLTVTVSDHEGTPLPNATVSVVTDPGTDGGENVGSATTNESGVATFEVERGTYEISASHEAYSAAGIAGPIDVSQGGESVDVTMPAPNDDGGENDDNETETHTLTVRTPGAPDGTAITVQRETGPDEEEADPITKDSAGGQASFSVPPGYYHAEADGYNPTLVSMEVDDDTEITLQEPGPDPIEVTVVDAETDEPIEGAEIRGLCHLWYTSGDAYVTGTTDANGVAQAQADVSPTECDARVEADGYEPADVPLSVPDDDGITVELTPASASEGDDSTAADIGSGVQAIAP